MCSLSHYQTVDASHRVLPRTTQFPTPGTVTKRMSYFHSPLALYSPYSSLHQQIQIQNMKRRRTARDSLLEEISNVANASDAETLISARSTFYDSAFRFSLLGVCCHCSPKGSIMDPSLKQKNIFLDTTLLQVQALHEKLGGALGWRVILSMRITTRDIEKSRIGATESRVQKKCSRRSLVSHRVRNINSVNIGILIGGLSYFLGVAEWRSHKHLLAQYVRK
ncbi:uncharacterized protein EDB93DRAFT_943651 [Suillus bovinus]|uniref:uncharacterized protein n=1 Tax=Suillus bovinus TaxID=48563 RepID=UPI001B87FA13|nr:uncharacterized protein EDB93DRAFT_943651 [Suillus bovinus]KAG2131249.1 hypothetical protein EDB93DRAFT_943651 [Suillus bovinus]